MMKRYIFALIGLTMMLTGFAQNNWNITAGGSISHLCEDLSAYDSSYGWGGGAYIGGGYEINFTPHWSLTPQLELNFTNNGASFSHPDLNFSARHADWRSFWSLNIPIIASFRFSLADNIGLRIGVGPYLQAALAGKKYKLTGDKKESLSGNFWTDRFNVGTMGEIAVEPSSHFSYLIRAQYPLLKEGWIRKTITLSIGIAYSF